MTDRNDEADDHNRKRKILSSLPIDVPSTSGEPSTAAEFPPWVAGGSPAKFVAPEELLKMSIAMDNLSLVHEIAIDPHFKISNAPMNPIEAVVKTNMRKVYWDLLKEDLEKDPPVLKHAFELLMEIRQIIHDDILSARHVRLRSEVNIILADEPLRNKMEQGSLDIKAVASFILELLGRLCSPERDSIIENLKKEDDLVLLISGIFELLEVMKNDLTNYVIAQNRSVVEAHSAKFEYDTFMAVLKKFPGGADITKSWLKQSFDEIFPISDEAAAPEAKKEKVTSSEGEELVKTTSRGYLKLVQEEEPSLFPETLRIDRDRIKALAEKYLQLMVTTSAIFITCNIAGKELTESAGFKSTIKNHLIAITNDISKDTFLNTLRAITEQCVKEIKEGFARLGHSFEEDQERILRCQLLALSEPRNAVRLLVVSRLSCFIEAMLCSPNEVPHRLLPGLSVIERELCAFTARLLCICVHNRRSFYDFYRSLLAEFRAERAEVLQSQPGPSY